MIWAIDLPDTKVGAVLPIDSYPMFYLLFNRRKNYGTMDSEVRLDCIFAAGFGRDYVIFIRKFSMFIILKGCEDSNLWS